MADNLAVADKLAGEGISVELIDLRTISPWDEDAVLSSVAKTRGAVVVHEAVRRFGVGASRGAWTVVAAGVDVRLIGPARIGRLRVRH